MKNGELYFITSAEIFKRKVSSHRLVFLTIFAADKFRTGSSRFYFVRAISDMLAATPISYRVVSWSFSATLVSYTVSLQVLFGDADVVPFRFGIEISVSPLAITIKIHSLWAAISTTNASKFGEFPLLGILPDSMVPFSCNPRVPFHACYTDVVALRVLYPCTVKNIALTQLLMK